MLILLSRLTVTSTTKPIFTGPGDLRPPQLGAEFGVLLELIVSFNEKHPSWASPRCDPCWAPQNGTLQEDMCQRGRLCFHFNQIDTKLIARSKPSKMQDWSVAFFILEVGGGIIKYILKYFKTFSLKSMIEGIDLWGPLWQIGVKKRSPLLGLILRALLRPSIDPRLHVDRPRCEICPAQCCWYQYHRRHSPFRA